MTSALAAGLAFGWWRVTPVQSGSMAPAIPSGSAVLLTPESFASVKVGDVIVYDPPTPGSDLLVHRVVDVNRTGSTVIVRTRGDANDAEDPWAAELVHPPIWRVRYVVPHAGFVVDLLRNRVLRLLLLPLAMLGLAVAALATLVQVLASAEQSPIGVADPDATPADVLPVMTTITAASLRAHRPTSLRSALAAAGYRTAALPDAAPAEVMPAAWYLDPTARYQHRFFDGTRWTDHVAMEGAQTTDVLG